MAFSTEEKNALDARVRYELGYSALTVAGEPHFTIAFAPGKALDSLSTGAETTSSTAVTDTSSPSTIVLASATGIAAGLRVHVDVGSQREVVVVQSVSGTNLTARFKKTHSGTYPIEVESGESKLRTLLVRLENIDDLILEGASTGGIKQIDQGDVVFFGSNDGSRLDGLRREQMALRDELGSLLKLPNLWRRHGTTRLEVY